MGGKTKATLQEYKQMTRLKETQEILGGDGMIEDLLTSSEQLIREMRINIAQLTDLEDFGAADMVTQILRAIEKRSWMLRSHLPK